MLITADEIISCNPCRDYPVERVRSLCGDGVTAAQVLASSIPYPDKRWLLTNILARRDRAALIAWVWRCLAGCTCPYATAMRASARAAAYASDAVDASYAANDASYAATYAWRTASPSIDVWADLAHVIDS